MSIDGLVAEINARNWVAYHYKRLHKVSINGGKMLNYPEAIERMSEMLNN